MKRLLAVFSLLVLMTAGLRAEERMYRLDVGEFNELKVVDGINVEFFCDSERAGTVEFAAPAEMASSIMFEPKKSKLTIMLASRSEPYTNLPTVRVYSSYLAKVSNEGDSLVRINSVADGAKFSCKVIGNGAVEVVSVKATDVEANLLTGRGTITIAGRANNASLKVTGSGRINALGLEAENINCKMTGTGTVECHPLKSLKMSGLGGTLKYLGTPEIETGLINRVKLLRLDQ